MAFVGLVLRPRAVARGRVTFRCKLNVPTLFVLLVLFSCVGFGGLGVWGLGVWGFGGFGGLEYKQHNRTAQTIPVDSFMNSSGNVVLVT